MAFKNIKIVCGFFGISRSMAFENIPGWSGLTLV